MPLARVFPASISQDSSICLMHLSYKKVEKTKIVTQFPITTGPVGYYFTAIFDRQRVADKSLEND